MKCAYVTGITQRRSCKGSVDPVTRVQTIRFINMKCHHNSRLLDHVLVLCQISLTSSCSDEVEHVKFPSDIEDAKQLGLVLSRYKDRYYAQVRVGTNHFFNYMYSRTLIDRKSVI